MVMKRNFVLKSSFALGILMLGLGFTIATSLQKTNKPRIFKVSGKIVRTGSYCGGAAPTQEIMDEINTPKPCARQKLYVRRGKMNDLTGKIILVFTSDSVGNFSFSLPSGVYSIVNEKKKDRKFVKSILKQYTAESKNYQATDKKCLDEWLKTPDATLEIKEGSVNDFVITFHDECKWHVPCTEYKGPFRP